ncbi:MAG TPA: hypothetical protein VI076_14140, partial [Actinopolymorphaceae bacterium]
MGDTRAGRLEARFDRLDRDANGFVERRDYETIPARLAEAIGERNEGVRRLEAAYLALWDRLRGERDADGDGRISRAEFVEAATNTLSDDDAYDRWLRPIVDAYVQALDRDGDGRLGTSELAAIGKSTGVAEHDVEAALGLADADHDGLLSAEELHALVEAF